MPDDNTERHYVITARRIGGYRQDPQTVYGTLAAAERYAEIEERGDPDMIASVDEAGQEAIDQAKAYHAVCNLSDNLPDIEEWVERQAEHI